MALLLALMLVFGPSASASSYTIVPGGAPLVVTTTSAGENATATFSGTAGQRIALNVTADSIGSAMVSIQKPDTTNLVAPVTMTLVGGFIDTKTLPVTGTYTILVDPQSTYVGSATLTLYNVPPDASTTITPGGASAALTMGTVGQNGAATFSGTAGHRVSLKIASTISSAKVSIVNPDSSNLVAPLTVGAAGKFIDTVTLPTTGTYTIVVDPQKTATGTATLTLYDVPADASTTITPGGAPVTVTTTIPGQNGEATFSGTVGQRVAVKITSTIAQAKVSILNPDASVLAAPTTFTTSGGFIDTKTLGQTGTYTIFVDPQTTSTGSMTLTLYNVPADVTSTITPGGASVPITTTVPGQNASLTFAGTAGQRISMKIASTMTSARVSIKSPDSSTLVAPVTVTAAGTFIDPKVLPLTGTYTIVVDPTTTSTGTMTLTLYTVPPDVASSITVGGSPVTVTLGTPGQNGTLTFSGTAGQRVSFKITSTVTQTRVSVLNPDSSVLVASTLVTGAGAFLDTKTLPATGTYTITIDPQGASTGALTFTAYNVPADVTGTITPGGSAVTVTMATPGQNASLTFSGTAGQRISIQLSNVTIGTILSGTSVSVLNPDTTALVGKTTVTTAGAFFDTKTLPATGTYTITIDPAAANTGSMTVTVYNVPPDVSTTITRGGAPVTVTTTTPGQNAAVTFSGTAGVTITLAISDAIGGTKVSILNPDSSVLVSPTAATSITKLLPTTGTYTIVVDPKTFFTGSVTLTLS